MYKIEGLVYETFEQAEHVAYSFCKRYTRPVYLMDVNDTITGVFFIEENGEVSFSAGSGVTIEKLLSKRKTSDQVGFWD